MEKKEKERNERSMREGKRREEGERELEPSDKMRLFFIARGPTPLKQDRVFPFHTASLIIPSD